MLLKKDFEVGDQRMEGKIDNGQSAWHHTPRRWSIISMCVKAIGVSWRLYLENIGKKYEMNINATKGWHLSKKNLWMTVAVFSQAPTMKDVGGCTRSERVKSH